MDQLVDERFKCQKNGLIRWIIIGIMLIQLPNTAYSDHLPQNGTRASRQLFGGSINIGPCRWIINKKCPDSDVNFYLYTPRNQQDRQFVQIDNTWESSNLSSSYFDPMDPVKIIIHGYNADMFIHPLIQMKDEYFQRGNYNLFFVDWSALALAPCYPAAARNTRHTGACIAQLVERILESGTDDIHLIGFSLGAQVTNFAARNLKSFKLPRITGLDPAMPLFITASNDNKLDPSDANFVDIIHTNALVQAKIERCGHVDFYMNGGIIQPGCRQAGGNIFACSHHRAPDYFSESIRSFKGFWGWACSSYINYLLGLCPPTNFLAIAGEDCKPATRGMFFVTTNSQEPFATGRWTDSKSSVKNALPHPYIRHDPLQQQIDQWGKLEGDFNNRVNDMEFNDIEWPYFSQLPTENGDSVRIENHSNEIRTNSKFNSKLEKNIEFVKKVKNKYETKQKVDDGSFESYKKNLENGIIDDDIFQLPEVKLVNIQSD